MNKPLNKGKLRCAGRNPLAQLACEKRDKCQRYLTMKLDSEFGLENYQGISVMSLMNKDISTKCVHFMEEAI